MSSPANHGMILSGGRLGKELRVSVRGSCHCQTVRLILTERPHEVIACDCSLCSRRGMLWAHYDDSQVATDGYTEGYVWGSETIRFHHCPKCGCTTHWHSNTQLGGRIGVNARLIDGFHEAGGASTSQYDFGNGPVAISFLSGATG